jgi:hypothetical protein
MLQIRPMCSKVSKYAYIERRLDVGVDARLDWVDGLVPLINYGLSTF